MRGASLIWALRGGNTPDFWQFNLYKGEWKILPPLPEPVGKGGALAYGPSEGNYYYVYAIVGNNDSSFYRYGPVPSPDFQPQSNIPLKWESMPVPLPSGAKEGASLVCEDARWGGIPDSMFYNEGQVDSSYRWWYGTIRWRRTKDLPWTIGAGSAMTSPRGVAGDYRLYLLRGRNTNRFDWRAVGSEIWQGRPLPTSESVGGGGALTIGPYGSTYGIYALVGNNKRSFYVLPRPGDEGGSQLSSLKTSPFSLFLYPNPLKSRGKIFFFLEEKELINLSLYDADGRIKKNLFLGELPRGRHSFSFKREEISPGIYFIILKAKKGKEIKKVIIN
ncbi:MAG: T9SS type A sorting domain-containing protein [candidate division WOR-3 bacterium]